MSVIVRVLLALATLLVPSFLFAQYRASLQGIVTDPSGAIVPQATLTLTAAETSTQKQATTNESGFYSVSGLAPGKYSLSVEKTGFTKQTFGDIEIRSEQAQNQDVKLAVASGTATTVTVSGTTDALIDTETATVGGTLSGEQIRNLPTFGRDPFQALALAPGAFGDNSRAASGSGAASLPGNAGPGAPSGSSSIFATENQVQVTADGQRTENNSFQVDGVEVNSLAWGGAAVITPNQESVKEITVQSNAYDAENGRNSGAQVLVVSKNGTNEFHGSALMKGDRPGLNAYQRWNGPGNPVQKDQDRYNQFAGSLGGPIIKNRLFAFFSYETLRNDTSTVGNGWFETPQFIQSVTSAVPNSIAAKILGFPGEGASYSAIIPKSCSAAGLPASQCRAVSGGLDLGSPLHSSLGAADPSYVSNGAPGIGSGFDGIPDVFFVQTANPTTSNPQQFNGRIDYQATSKDLIFFSEYFVPVSTDSYNGPVRAANFWHNDRLNEAGSLVWNRTILPTWLNEVRFNVTRWHWNEINSNPQEPFGLPLDTVDPFGAVNVQAIGAPGPSIFNQTTYNIRDTSTIVVGNHNLKFGADIYKEQDNDSQSYAARPSYGFRNMWDLANDAPYSETGNFNPLTGEPSAATKYIRSSIYAFFVQDNYKVRPNLTLNLGVRWEYFQPVHEKYGNISNVVLGNGADPLTGLSIKVGGSLYQPDYKNIGPQVGFAWTPFTNNQRMVIRGGFGIGYNRMEEAITLNGRANPPLIVGLNLFNQNVLYAASTGVRNFNGFPVNPAAIVPFGSNGLPANGTAVSLNAFPQNLVTPRTYRYSLDTNYVLAQDWILKVGYQGSASRHLTVQTNLNFLYSPLNPGVQNLNWYYNSGNSSFNALLSELEHRFSKNFQVDAQYRWSHSIDNGSNSYYIDPYPYGLNYSKGDSDFDVRHNVKVYGLYTPKILEGHGIASKLLGGWQLTGILNAHSGFPFTPTYSNTGCNVVYANSGYCSLRPAAYLGGAGTDQSNATFQNEPNSNFPKGALGYFAVPTFPASGIPAAPGVGRNTFRTAGFFDVDMTAEKSFGLPKMRILGENARITLRGDLFNIFNKLNINPGFANGVSNVISFDGTSSNPQFGIAQAGLSGRIVELQARFSF